MWLFAMGRPDQFPPVQKIGEDLLKAAWMDGFRTGFFVAFMIAVVIAFVLFSNRK